MIAYSVDRFCTTAAVRSFKQGGINSYILLGYDGVTADGGYNPSLICVTAGTASTALEVGAGMAGTEDLGILPLKNYLFNT